MSDTNNWGMIGGANQIVEVRGVSVHLKPLNLETRMAIGKEIGDMPENADSVKIIYEQLTNGIAKIEFPDDSPMKVWNDKPVLEVLKNISDMSIILALIEVVVQSNKLTPAQEKN